MALISDAIRKQFGLNLVGIDVIIDKKTGQYGIIDVNAFPGGCIICSSRSCLHVVSLQGSNQEYLQLLKMILCNLDNMFQWLLKKGYFNV